MIIRKEYLANADRIGVELRPSTNFRKLLDVYKHGEFICHIGSTNHPSLFDILDKAGEEIAYTADMKRSKRNRFNGTLEYFYESQIMWWYQFREFGMTVVYNNDDSENNS